MGTGQKKSYEHLFQNSVGSFAASSGRAQTQQSRYINTCFEIYKGTQWSDGGIVQCARWRGSK